MCADVMPVPRGQRIVVVDCVYPSFVHRVRGSANGTGMTSVPLRPSCALVLLLCAAPAAGRFTGGMSTMNVTFRVHGGPQRAVHGRRASRADMDLALGAARELVERSCPSSGLRVAPLVHEDMSTEQGAGPLMYAQAPFVLMNVSTVSRRAGHVYVPAALVGVLTADNVSDVVWTTTNLTLEEKRQRVAEMWRWIPYHVYVHVNTQHEFSRYDPECSAIVDGGHSAVTILTHELLHGMGVYSLSTGDDDTTDAHVSVFDALLQTTPGPCDRQDPSCFLVHAPGDRIGRATAGTPLWINSTRIYNPVSFERGSSLSHVDEDDALMRTRLRSGTCMFGLARPDVELLTAVGWRACSVTGASVDEHGRVRGASEDTSTDLDALGATLWLLGVVCALAYACVLVCYVVRRAAVGRAVRATRAPPRSP